MKQKELYNELTKEMTEIKNLDNSVDRDKDKLIYRYKGNTSDVDFREYYGAIDFINKIEDGYISLKQAIKIKIRRIKKRKPKKEVNKEFKCNKKC